jgi:hypothetical protein
MNHYGLTSGTDSFAYKHNGDTVTIIINPDDNYYTYSRPFAEVEVEEFEFVEKKSKPHHIRKKKGWER